MALKLHVVIASTRPGRLGPKVASWFVDAARDNGKFDVELVDLEAFDLPVYDEPKHPRLQDYQNEHTKKWSASVASADAFVFVTPEYNHFAPPSLVNAIDFVLKEWAYKPAGMVSYSGLSGGMRSAQSLKPLLTTVKMMPIPEIVAVPYFANAIEDGSFKASDVMVEGANQMLDELHRWSQALKPLREG